MNITPQIDMIATGRNIKSLREKEDITVKELQEIMGFNNPTAIYKWQAGMTLPSIDNLLILSKLFKVRIEDIIVEN